MRGNLFAFFDVRDSAGDLQDAVVGPGGQAEAVHGRLHEPLGTGVDPAILADMARLLALGSQAIYRGEPLPQL